MYPLHPGRNPQVSGFSTIASIAIAGLSINASCGNPGTEFASLLTSACPICIPPIPCADFCEDDDCGEACEDIGPFVVGCDIADPTPIPRPTLGPFSAAVALPPRMTPIPSSIPPPATIPARRVIGPAIDDIWFIM